MSTRELPTAEQARRAITDITNANLLTRITKAINKAIDEQKYSTVVYADKNDIIHAHLENLGYTVKYEPSFRYGDGSFYRIAW